MIGETVRTVSNEDYELQYTLKRKAVKNLNLRIRKDCSVCVSANPSVPSQQVDEFVKKKMEYIRAAQKKFMQIEENTPAPKRFISGESFYILGRELRLKVIETSEERVYSDGVYMFLCIKNAEDFKKKQRMVKKYIDTQSVNVYEDVIRKVYPTFQKYGVPFPKLRIRDMETRWGSCIPQKGVITLNKRLIEVPMNCVEYVVMHEFCHFIHPDHSKRFYALLSMLMPDWKERKIALEKNASYGL